MTQSRGTPVPRRAVSTLGAPGQSIEWWVSLARCFDIEALEIRFAEGEFLAPGMSAARRTRVGRQLAEHGLMVLSVSTYVQVCSATPTRQVLGRLCEALHAARDVGAAGVRVLPGGEPNPAGGETPQTMDAIGIARLRAAVPEAEEHGVDLYLETHDSHPRGADIARLLAGVDSPRCLAVWDAAHPWRWGEAPEETAEFLQGRLAYLQFKDGIRGDTAGSIALTRPGEGEIPAARMGELAVSAAAGSSPGVWASLEWEKLWHPQLPELEIACAAAEQWAGGPWARR